VPQGGLLDEAMEVLFQCTRAFGRSPGARAVHQPLGAMAGKALDPCAAGGIGQGEGARDGLQALTFDDLTHGWGTAEDARLFRLFQEGISSGEGIIGTVEFESPHMRVSNNKILQKYTNSTSHDVFTLLSAQNLFASNFPGAALAVPSFIPGSATTPSRPSALQELLNQSLPQLSSRPPSLLFRSAALIAFAAAPPSACQQHPARASRWRGACWPTPGAGSSGQSGSRVGGRGRWKRPFDFPIPATGVCL
jgi:hypothetical protein